MGVGTAITLLIGWISQQVDKYHEAKNAAEESAKKQREAFESYASSVGSNASGTITKFEALKQKYNDLGDSLSAKKKFIKENTDVFKELGVKLNNVNDADNLFINNSEAFVASVDARARATATMEVAAEKYKEAFKKMLEAENVRDTQKELEESGYTKIVQSGGLNVLDDKQRDELNKKIKRDKKVKRLYAALPHISDPGVRKIVSDKLSERKKEIVKEFLNSVIEDLEEQAKVAEKEGSQASVTGYKFNEAARSRLRDAGITTTADDEAAQKAQQAAEKRAQAQADAQKKLAEIIASGELALWQSQIDSMNEGQEKELEQLDLNTQKKIDAILQAPFPVLEGNAFLGGILRNYDSNLLLSSTSPYSVIEADEYDRSFHTLTPYIAVVTATDPDHLDIYGNEENYLESFAHFTELIRPDGILLLHEGLKLKPRPQAGVKTYTYSRDHGDFHAENIRRGHGTIVFDFVTPSGVIPDIELGVPVEINIENSIAAMAACMLTGDVSPELMREAMATFLGAERRFQFLLKDNLEANPSGKVIIDDYAHHPDEIRQSILSVRALYPNARITAAFQPHLYTRTRDFADQFAAALDLADEVILTDLYPAREEPIPGISEKTIFDMLKTPNKSLIAKQDFVDTMKNRNFEVLLALGAGDLSFILPQLVDEVGK